MTDNVTVTWKPYEPSEGDELITEDLLAPMIKRMSEELDSKPEPSWPHRLVINSRKLDNGNVIVGADYVPIPEDEVNLDCDGC